MLSARDRDQAAAQVAQAFESAWGQAPDGVWSAPGRINVIGEHVDYQDGLCLPAALPHRTYAAVRLRDDDLVRARSVQDAHDWEGRLAEVGPGTPSGWTAYVVGVAWALAQRGHTVPGFDVVVDSDVPVGAGLSSSAALECSIAVALRDLVPGLADVPTAELVAACIDAENVVAGASTGGLDQAIALQGADEHALLLDCRDFSGELVPLALADRGLAILVCDTKAHHSLVDGQYGSRREESEAAARALGVDTLREVAPDDLDAQQERLDDPRLAPRLRHVVTEIDRVRQCVEALRAQDLDQVGRLLQASHASLRDDYEVSCAELDLAVEAAQDAGALGARMVGGGFGGSIIALVREEEVDQVVSAIRSAFADAGLAEPQFLLATASAGADRDR